MTRPRLPHVSLAGIIVGLGFLWLSLTPSLLPVPWLYQGLVCGVSVAIGYGIGAFLG